MWTPSTFYPTLKTYCQTLPQEFSAISVERKKILDETATYITAKLAQQQPIQLTFICTHNSRRSQFGQAWGKVAAAWYGYESQVTTFSGGTEATAFHPNSIAALKRAGFVITPQTVHIEPNLRQNLQYSSTSNSQVMFSKKYSDLSNPSKDFCAIMVCSNADEACPVVYGADKRISLPYVDPKRADGTPQETQAYDTTCREIAREMFYVFDQVRQKQTKKSDRMK